MQQKWDQRTLGETKVDQIGSRTRLLLENVKSRPILGKPVVANSLGCGHRYRARVGPSCAKLDGGLCLSRTKICADYNSRGFKIANSVTEPASFSGYTTTQATQDAQSCRPCETLRSLKNQILDVNFGL